MTDLEKISDGLRACISVGENGVTHGDCRICPYAKVYECRLELEKDALELIKEQKQKISVLQRAIEQAQKPDKLLDVFGKNYAKIVRCKDCKHYNKDTGHCKSGIIHGYAETWFCADGKPKESTLGTMIMEKDCFTCANSFVDDDDKLHCMADGHDHEQTVDDNHVCDDWKC